MDKEGSIVREEINKERMMEEGGNEEDIKKKVGRPRKIEELTKERRNSMRCIEEFLKRKREGGSEEDKEGEERGLRRSKKKTEMLYGEIGGVEREELKKMMEEMGERIAEKVSEEMRKLKMEIWKKEGEWREERREMKKKIEGLEKRLGDLEARMEEKGKKEESVREGEEEGNKGINETIMGKMKDIGKKLEWKEREERRNNIVIRRLEGGKEDIKERVEKIMKEIGVKTEIEWIRKLKGKEGEEGEMVVVKLGSREQKRQVMERKKVLRGKRVRIEDDLTWEERKMKWKLAEIAEGEKKKGNKVWTSYGRIKINEVWWKWEEEEGVLKNWRGEIREEIEKMEKEGGSKGKRGRKKGLEEGEREKREGEGGKDEGKGGEEGKRERDTGRRKEEKRGVKRKERREEWKIGFWNVAGLKNKEEKFWKTIENWEVVVMMETWIDERGWEVIKKKLPKGYRWEKQAAKKRKKKGRPMRGMIMGIKEEGGRIKAAEIGEKREGIMVADIEVGREKWRVIGIYINGDMERKMEELKEWTEEKEGNKWTIVGGDFNARTGRRGGVIGGEEEEERRSKDKKVNEEGKKLIKEMEEVGWGIFNGGIRGDKKGEFTYTGGRGESVIDYVVGEERVKEKIKRMEVGDNIESDHHPLIVTLKRRGGNGKGNEKRREGRGKRKGGRWTERGGERIREGK